MILKPSALCDFGCFFAGQFNFKGDRDLSAFLTTAKEVGLMVLLRAGPYMCGEVSPATSFTNFVSFNSFLSPVAAQWEFGGLPAWLLNPYYAPNLVIRTYNPTYIWYVDRWWANLFAVVKPHLYENGGPVIMTQVRSVVEANGLRVCVCGCMVFVVLLRLQMENEFGSYGDVSTNPLDKQV